MNNKLGKIPFAAVCFYVVLGLAVTWQEYYSPMDFKDYEMLMILRLILLGSIVPAGFALRKNPFSVWANTFVCLNFLAYTCIGHYYRPMYFASYVQTLYGFSFLFFTSRRLYFILSTVQAVGYSLFYLLTYDLVKYRQGAETKEDFVSTIIVIYGLGFIIHHFFTAERGLKEAATDRFVLLGRHASNIIHDIKGSISIPQLYLGEVRKSLQNKDYAQVDAYLDKMERSLSRTEKTIFDLNQLSRIASDDEQSFPLQDGMKDVLDMLSKRLHDVEIKMEGNFDFKGDRGIICSIFLNLILNSLENFKRSKTDRPQIEILIDANSRSISVTDNGGGFSKEALHALKSNHPNLTTTSNSGLGLYLVRENLRTLKGKVSFQNIDQRAKVEIKLGRI